MGGSEEDRRTLSTVSKGSFPIMLLVPAGSIASELLTSAVSVNYLAMGRGNLPSVPVRFHALLDH